jgi:hypothetical protein
MGIITALNGLLGIIPAFVWAIALAGALATGCVEKLRYDHLDSAIKVERADHIQAVAAATERVNAAEKANQLKQIEAQNVKAKNQILIKAAADSANVSLHSLRDTASAYTSTCDVRAETIKAVFSECAGAITELAATADRIEGDRQLLIDSWLK